ncbi:MAG: putative PEP-binding protein [Polyangiaceae bacterium]
MATSPSAPTAIAGTVATRDPRTGERRLVGEYRALSSSGSPFGASTPITTIDGRDRGLDEIAPSFYHALAHVCYRLEVEHKDLLEVEFQIHEGVVTVGRHRVRDRAPKADVRMLVEMAREGLITKEEAVRRAPASRISELQSATLDPDAPREILATGLAAGLGAAVGQVALDSVSAGRMVAQGRRVILVRRETSPEDVHGLRAASGIIVIRGGMTSHAAVVARVLGKCCIASCPTISVDEATQTLTIQVPANGETPARTVVVASGETLSISVDSRGGQIFLGEVPMVPGARMPELDELLSWADEFRTMRVRANADSAAEVATARSFGAEGVGLCRTEHMFLAPDRVAVLRRLLLSTSPRERIGAHDELVAFQREDLAALLRAARGLPVTIRLLDPPLHEFLPGSGDPVTSLAAALGISPAALARRIEARREVNPMLGQRGVRIAFTEPEIYASQARAMLEAMCDVEAEGVPVDLEILIPLVLSRGELDRCRELIDNVASHVSKSRDRTVSFKLGVMIELPRAALTADSIAPVASSFSFGTNDLTQTTLGLSRDDAAQVLEAYRDAGAMPSDPFRTLDIEGVGSLIRTAIERGREANGFLGLGVCGEHAADPASIRFFQTVGIEYISVAPALVAVARLAAAQAKLATNLTHLRDP